MGENASSESRKVERWLESALDSVDEAERLAEEMAQELGFPEDDLHKIGWRSANRW